MDQETMDLGQLAAYLRRDKREVTRLVDRGKLPGRKVGGEWRFSRAEVNHWLETQLPGYTEEELTALEDQDIPGETPLLSSLMSESAVAVPLAACTKDSVLRALVRLAEQTWHVYDPDAVLTAIRQREELASTALGSGVAIPHPHRPLPAALGESVIAYGRTGSGIPFGGPRGELTDIFFLMCCRDHRTHLGVLARLSRLFLRPGFLDDLRAADSPAETLRVIADAEAALGQS